MQAKARGYSGAINTESLLCRFSTSPVLTKAPGFSICQIDLDRSHHTPSITLRAEGGVGESARRVRKGHLPVLERGLTEAQGKMSAMPDAAAPDIPLATYATAAQQRAYIAAMKKIRAARKPGEPVRVYICVAPQIAQRVQWDERLAKIRHRLPGVELVQFGDVFTPENYAEKWPELAPTFDGLVVVGMTKRGSDSHVYRLGETARLEVIDFVKAGKPVLLHARRYGLIPFVDCKIRRVGEARLRTKVTIPAGWDPQDYEPTLQAARRALRPRPIEPETKHADASPHLTHPFAAPPR